MAIMLGVAAYIGAVVCVCALVGATRAKRERCIRATRRRGDGLPFAEEAGMLSGSVVSAGAMRRATRG